MCGIFGYIGNKPAHKEIRDGLKKLEYRGYDSCGICLEGNNNFVVSKAIGSTENLTKAKNKSQVGIGHTRWATHGDVTIKNAHPHLSSCKTVVLVHNGVIENNKFIASKLTDCKLKSETDSEILANLIAKHYIGDFTKAVENALKDVRGSYGIAVMHKKHPGTIICAKKGSPICIGIGKHETCVASDASALPLTINKVAYLDDNQLAVISTDSELCIKDSDKIIDPEINKLEAFRGSSSYKGYDCFLEKEIYEQGEAIKNAMRGRFDKDNTYVKFGGIKIPRKVRRVVFLGCGTAYHAGIVGKYYMENIGNVPATVEYSSEFKYKHNPIDANTLVVAISQSGETADTITAVEEAQNRDAMVISITNTVASTIARMTGNGIYQYAGPEMSVASTKAYTSQICILAMLAIMIGRKNGLSQIQAKKYIKDLKRLPKLIDQTIKLVKPACKRVGTVYSMTNSFTLLGKQYMYPTAIEGALKIKELTYAETHGYPAGEIKHGPLAAIGHHSFCFFLAPQEDMYEKNLANIEEIKARDTSVAVITQEGLEFEEDTGVNRRNYVIRIPKSPDILHPILCVIPLQLFSMYLAKSKGLDIDRPRHLAKSVTVE
jgi:glucosamine--fructose-6-phosphate aminotransferase (isomerizing)